MENNKYYTPELEEFNFGFEFEYIHPFLPEDKDPEWQPYNWKSQMATVNLTPWGISIGGFVIKQEFIRVKYLDKEYIESLGFDNYIPPIEYNHSWNYMGSKEPKLYIWFNNPIPIVRIYSSFPTIIFQGIIKNKSELKRLMKQLGIWK